MIITLTNERNEAVIIEDSSIDYAKPDRDRTEVISNVGRAFWVTESALAIRGMMTFPSEFLILPTVRREFGIFRKSALAYALPLRDDKFKTIIRMKNGHQLKVPISVTCLRDLLIAKTKETQAHA